MTDSTKPIDPFSWWQSLNDNRGIRAELKRCKTLQDVMFCQGFYQLLYLMPDNRRQPHRVAMIAAVLANIKTTIAEPTSMGELWSKAPKGEKPPMSGLRFRRLMSNRTHESAFRLIVQSLGLIQHRAHLPTLIEDLYWWDSQGHLGTRQRWTGDYYRNALDAS